MLPAIQAARSGPAAAQCVNQLKQLGLAAHDYHDANQSFPLGMEMMPGLVYTKATFFIRLLPYLEQAAPLCQWDFNKPYNNVSNVAANSRATPLAGLVCPSDLFQENPFLLNSVAVAFPPVSQSGAVGGYYSPTSYAGNYGEGSYYFKSSQFPIKPDGLLFLTGSDPQLVPQTQPGGALDPKCDSHRNLPPVRFADITDGASNTLMMGEKFHQDAFFDSWTIDDSGEKMYMVSAWAWAGGMKGTADIFCSSAVPINKSVSYYTSKPNDISAQDRRFNGWGSGHPGGVCFLFGDGSARFTSESLDQPTLVQVSTRAGGEVVSSLNQ